jgi:hypothetical protein
MDLCFGNLPYSNRRISWAELESEFAALPAGRYDHVLGVRPTGWTHQTGSSPEDSLSAIRIVK